MTAQEARECLEHWLQGHCSVQVEIVSLFPRQAGSWLAVLAYGTVYWQQGVSSQGEVSGPPPHHAERFFALLGDFRLSRPS
jgi:hypothetical protein